MKEDTKLAQIRKAMKIEDWDVALKIAGTFVRLGEHSDSIKRASDSINNPKFYEQMGYNLAELKEEGIAALKERFSSSWREIDNTKN